MGRKWGVLVVLALMTACGHPPIERPAGGALTLPDTLLVKSSGPVGPLSRVPLEQYVVVAALSEVSPTGEPDAVVARIFDVQTVVARTYAVRNVGRHRADGYDLCDTTHCQVYNPERLRASRFADAARAAGRRTTGLVVAYGTQLAETVFHADCGGATTDASDVWGRIVPYLIRRVDDLPAPTHRPWHFEASVDELRRALNADPRSTVGRRLDAIDVVARDASQRVVSIAVRGETGATLKGDTFRTILNRALGVRSLQSTKFSFTRRGTTYAFDGSGFGHGVGLCQRGAITRARQGQHLAEIIDTYYPGTEIVRAAR
jgi:stage II sporulation protein D